MSLLCSETGDVIEYNTPLWAITRSDTNYFCALSQEALNRIPQAERRDRPGSFAKGDVDIYSATSTPNEPFYREAYSLMEFKQGEFRFSVSRETMGRYAPHALEALNKCKPLTTH